MRGKGRVRGKIERDDLATLKGVLGKARRRADDVSEESPGKGDKKVVRLADLWRESICHFCLHSRLSVYYRVYSVKRMTIPKAKLQLVPSEWISDGFEIYWFAVGKVSSRWRSDGFEIYWFAVGKCLRNELPDSSLSLPGWDGFFFMYFCWVVHRLCPSRD